MNLKLFKIILDIIMFIITFILLNINITGNFLHALLGSMLALLLILHVYLNKRWLINVSKNFKKVKSKMKVMCILDYIIMISFIITILAGILISNDIYPFKMGSNFNIVLIHLIFGRLSAIIMLIHVGIHFDKMIKDLTIRAIVYIVYSAIVLVITVYQIYTLTQSFPWMVIFG